MHKKIITILIVLVVILAWYFFAPIKWTFNLRPPRDWGECKEVGGRIDNLKYNICEYKGKQFYLRIVPL